MTTKSEEKINIIVVSSSVIPFSTENTVQLQHKKGIGSIWFTASSLSWEHRVWNSIREGYVHPSTPQRRYKERAKCGYQPQELPGEVGRGKGDWKAPSALHRWDSEQGTADLQRGRA